jgi:glycoprotein endo-alpha-1,2-mannosidase
MARKASLVVFALLLAACNVVPPVTPTNPTSSPTSAPATTAPTPMGPEPSYKVAAFYYPWYGTPQFEGQWRHWPQNGHTPPVDVGSDFYPVLGAYSSSDPTVLDQHMRWLRDAGVGVIIVSWWGQGSREEQPLPLILEAAARYNLKVAFHIEPYNTRTAAALLSDVKYIYQRYGNSPAFFRSTATSQYSPNTQPKGMFFVWCIQSAGSCGQLKVEAGYWLAAVDAVHALPEGGLVIANTTNPGWISGGHFDGLYNYATLHLQKSGGFAWARTMPAGSLYIPSVIPGFSAQRVGYSTDTTVPRNDGQTYNDQWQAALNAGVQPAMVTITSFNEWHEGSMIEQAAEGKDDGRGSKYLDFGALGPGGYLALTRQWVEKLAATPQAGTYHARIEVKTTSDWTTVALTKGGAWLQPELVDASGTATKAGFELGDNLILTQSPEDANKGVQVQMTWDVELAGLEPGGVLSFQIDRGSIGATQLTVYRFTGGEPEPVGVFNWGGVTSGRNSDIVTLAADKIIGK